jgi:hypothetical protein
MENNNIELSRRDHFLLNMYNQLMNDINRHILVAWQSIAALASVIGAFMLSSSNIVPLQIWIAALFIVCDWHLKHTFDASFWYNRNLVIIGNIEREFFVSGDETIICCYFVEHRKKNKMISHLKIQRDLGYFLMIFVFLICLFRVYGRVQGGTTLSDYFSLFFGTFRLVDFVPTLALIYSLRSIIIFKNKTDVNYNTFLKNSPGKSVFHNVDFSNTHGQDRI